LAYDFPGTRVQALQDKRRDIRSQNLTVPAERTRALVRIKVLHTVIWALFVVCILAIPVAAVFRHFAMAWILSGLVLLECGILAVNGGRCPLTPIAGRFTEDRTDAFDIYLPAWLARWNKQLFGTIFVAGELVALWLRFHSR
jgi:hypothetical protein